MNSKIYVKSYSIDWDLPFIRAEGRDIYEEYSALSNDAKLGVSIFLRITIESRRTSVGPLPIVRLWMIDIRLTYAWLVWAKGVDPNLYQPLEILRWTDEQNDVESSPFVSVGAIRLPTKFQRWQNKLFYVPDLKSVFISIYSKVTILISTIAIYRATLILTRMSVHEYPKKLGAVPKMTFSILPTPRRTPPSTLISSLPSSWIANTILSWSWYACLINIQVKKWSRKFIRVDNKM